MDEFADMARARAAYQLYADAMNKGRDILSRAGIAAARPRYLILRRSLSGSGKSPAGLVRRTP